MKKFCSECGNQFELSQRLCEKCGAVNPFFVAAFTFLSDQSEALERLRLEKEKIEKELLEKEEAQAEFKRQEALRKQKEDKEKSTFESTERERLLNEFDAREKASNELRVELQRIKEETERYKTETYNLVSEVKQELHQIENENKRLQHEIESLSRPVANEKATATPSQKSSLRNVWFIVLSFIFLGTSAAVAYIIATRSSNEQPEVSNKLNEAAPLQQTKDYPTIDSLAVAEETQEAPIIDTTIIETLKTTEPTQIAKTSEPSKPVPPATTKQTTFTPSTQKIKSDLNGKKISGCGITINDPSEIKGIGKIALVEKLPSGSLKFSCTMNVVQDDESYNANPYLYYTADGIFIKVDGTNCE